MMVISLRLTIFIKIINSLISHIKLNWIFSKIYESSLNTEVFKVSDSRAYPGGATAPTSVNLTPGV